MNADRVSQIEPLLAEAVEAALPANFHHLTLIADELKRRNPTGPQPEIDLIAAGLHYIQMAPEQREEPFGVFGPMWQFDGTSYPPPATTIANDVLAIWADAMHAAMLPEVRARFADLLWVTRYGTTPFQYAQEAVDAYLATAGSPFREDVTVADGLARAYELAREIDDPTRRMAVLDVVEAEAANSLSAPESKPGVSLALMRTMTEGSRAQVRSTIFALLDDADARYGQDPWLSNSIQEIRSRVSEVNARPSIWRQAVATYAAEARRSSGLRKYALLQEAIELAVAHNLGPEAEMLRIELQEISPEEFELQEVTVSSEMPRQEIQRYIDSVVGEDSLDHALSRFGSIIPSGKAEANVEFASQQMKENPIRFHITGMRTGPENVLIRKLSTPDEHHAQVVIDSEQMRIAFFAHFAVDMLSEMRSSYGPISERSDWFASEFIDPQVVARIRVALERYEAGDFDSSVSILAPRLERVLRRMAATVGLVITRMPGRNGQPGGVKGLGEILSAMKDRLPTDSFRYFWALLCEPTAQNLRNRVGHGLSDEFTAHDAALLIQAFCHVRGMGISRQPDPPGGEYS